MTLCKICGGDAEVEDPDEPHICSKCFRCPKCGATPAGPATTAMAQARIRNGTWLRGECTVDDMDQYVCCSVCGKGWNYRAFEKALMKQDNRKPCPTCRGCGTVKA